MKKAAFYIFLMFSVIAFAGCAGSAYVGSTAPYYSYYPYYPYAPMRTQVMVVPPVRHRWGSFKCGPNLRPLSSYVLTITLMSYSKVIYPPLLRGRSTFGIPGLEVSHILSN